MATLTTNSSKAPVFSPALNVQKYVAAGISSHIASFNYQEWYARFVRLITPANVFEAAIRRLSNDGPHVMLINDIERKSNSYCFRPEPGMQPRIMGRDFGWEFDNNAFARLFISTDAGAVEKQSYIWATKQMNANLVTKFFTFQADTPSGKATLFASITSRSETMQTITGPLAGTLSKIPTELLTKD